MQFSIKNIKIIILFFLTISVMLSCGVQKPLTQAYINDGEMILSIRKIEKSEISFQLYREGAAGATGGKSSGGCGCN